MLAIMAGEHHDDLEPDLDQLFKELQEHLKCREIVIANRAWITDKSIGAHPIYREQRAVAEQLDCSFANVVCFQTIKPYGIMLPVPLEQARRLNRHGTSIQHAPDRVEPHVFVTVLVCRSIHDA